MRRCLPRFRASGPLPPIPMCRPSRRLPPILASPWWPCSSRCRFIWPALPYRRSLSARFPMPWAASPSFSGAPLFLRRLPLAPCFRAPSKRFISGACCRAPALPSALSSRRPSSATAGRVPMPRSSSGSRRFSLRWRQPWRRSRAAGSPCSRAGRQSSPFLRSSTCSLRFWCCAACASRFPRHGGSPSARGRCFRATASP